MINGGASLTNPTVVLPGIAPKSGKVVCEKKNVRKYHAAIIRCGPAEKQRLLMLDDEGYLTLFEANPKEYTELARTKVCGNTWAHPALVDGKLYLRDDKELLCF